MIHVSLVRVTTVKPTTTTGRKVKMYSYRTVDTNKFQEDTQQTHTVPLVELSSTSENRN